ncbi:MAG: hypothetical protein H0U70_08435 [Tatlockia sp.]|nr:hypothetical protein [Tatlockia sp.]
MIGMQLVRHMGIGLQSVVRALGRVGLASSYFIRDAFRAHYNIIGQFTAPIEQELLGIEPPSHTTLNYLGQLALTPLAIVSWLIALTIAPLLYNSWRLLKPAFLFTANLALLDLPPEAQIKLSDEEKAKYNKMALLRFIYGLPGIILSVLLGFTATMFLAAGRIVLNSIQTLFRAAVFITSFALDKEDQEKIKQYSLENNDRSRLKTYGFGFIGLILGLCLGALGFNLVILTRIITNSYQNIKQLALSGLNLARHEDEQKEGSFKFDTEQAQRKLVLGAPGLILGLLSFSLGLMAGIIERTIIQSWKTAKDLSKRITKLAFLYQEEQSTTQLANLTSTLQQGSNLDYYLFGAPGLLLGTIAGSIGFGTMSLWRVIVNSWLTARRQIIKLTNLALHKDDLAPVPVEKRLDNYFDIYLLGAPGFIIGTLVGSCGFIVFIFGRIITNSLKSALSVSGSGINLALHEEEQISIGLENDHRPEYMIYGLGLLGVVIGSFGATLGFSFALIRRTLIESAKSAYLSFEVIINEAKMIAEDARPEYLVEIEPKGIVSPILITKTESRSIFDQFFLGGPGLVLGGLLGSLATLVILARQTISQSYLSAKHSFASVTNLGLHPDHQIKNLALFADKRQDKQKYIFGLPGVLLGGVAGILGFFIIGVARNSFESSIRLSVSSLNTVRNEQLKEDFAKDPRNGFFKYILGFPGLIIGTVLGASIVSIVLLNKSRIQSWLTTREFFELMVRGAFSLGERIQEIEDEPTNSLDEGRSKFERYALGGPGLFVGLLSGLVAATFLLIGRSLINSYQSGLIVSIQITNLGLESEKQIESEIDRDPRSRFSKFFLGFPGLVLGGIVGVFGFMAAIVGRSLNESYKNIRRLVISGINFASYGDDQLPDSFKFDSSNFGQKYILGFPGLVLGILIAPIGTLIRGSIRTVVESWKTATIVYAEIANLAKETTYELGTEENFELSFDPEDEGFTEQGFITFEGIQLQTKPFSFVNHYFFGAPGFLLGLIVGGLGFTSIIVGRIWQESKLSAINVFWFSVSQALDENYELKIIEPPRSKKLKYGFGLPGFILGGLAGAVSFAAIGCARLIDNSAISTIKLLASAINLIRHKQIAGSLKEDKRSESQKRLGIPGLVIGSLIAPVALILALAERAIIETLKTTTELFILLTSQAFSSKISSKESFRDQRFKVLMPSFGPRSTLDIYFFGFFGLVFGVVSGALGFLGVGIIRGIDNSISSGHLAFVYVANQHEGYSYQQLNESDERSWFEKFVLGAPGILLGSFLGGLKLIGISFVKLSEQSFISWRALSGSIVNGSLELPVFEGLSADNRKANKKILGGLGYLLALVTTLVPATVFFTAKKFLLASALAIGLLGSPIVAALKWAKQAFIAPRFEKRVNNIKVDETEQRFKNLYSSLSPFGLLNENEAIKSHQDGRKGPATFIRKALTLDISTPTEEILEELLLNYRQSKNQAEFLNSDKEFDAIIESIKDHYRALSCTEHEQFQIKPREEQIEEVGAFVRDYLRAKKNNVPDGLYSKNELSWTAVFWGRSQANIAQDAVLDLGTDPMYKMV